MPLNGKKETHRPQSEYNQLIERGVWAGQLKQSSKFPEVDDEVVSTEGPLSQEEGVG